MIAGGRRIDPKLAPLDRSTGVVAFCINVVATVGADLLPSHYEVASAVHLHTWTALISLGRGVPAELAAVGGAVFLIQLRVNAQSTAVLVCAAPNDDEFAVPIRRYLRPTLLAGRVGVDLN